MHVVMEVSKLNSILFKGNVNNDFKVLKVNNNVQLLHIITTEFWYGIKAKKKKSKKKTMAATTATAETTTASNKTIKC